MVYADTIANAYLAMQPRDLQQLVAEYSGGLYDQKGTRVFYQVPKRGERGLKWQAYPGDRNPLRMSRSRLAAWATRRLAGETSGSPCQSHSGEEKAERAQWRDTANQKTAGEGGGGAVKDDSPRGRKAVVRGGACVGIWQYACVVCPRVALNTSSPG